MFEASGQRGALPREIRPLRPGLRISAPAFTAQCGPRDNLALHHAIAAAPAGSVLVCHTGGWYDAGYFGDVMAKAAEMRALAGLVIDACVRDYAEVAYGALPIFCRGLSIVGTTKDPQLLSGVGRRIRVGQVDVDPGDLVIGDDDGVVVVARERVPGDLASGEARVASETEVLRRLNDGELTMDIFGLPPLIGPDTSQVASSAPAPATPQAGALPVEPDSL